MKVVAFLPVKGTSTRIANKNIQLLDGKPLFMHTLEKLMECDFIDEVYLDTESDEIIDSARYTGCQILKRDPSLATNKTDGNQLLLNEAKHADADIYIQALCTSPFIEIATIRNAVETLKTNQHYDSATLIKKEKLYTWSETAPNYDITSIPNSADLPETRIETMGLYAIRASALQSLQRRVGDSPYLIEVEALEAVDVNYPDEFSMANLIMAGKREKEREQFRNLSKTLNSAILSDIFDEMELPGYVHGLSPNDPRKKIMGRAKTLHLRKLKVGEDPAGIYKALNSYRTIVPGDVIVVENETPEFAYFGNLNASLAIRQGAAGAVIDGNTRDSKDVLDLDFPVFARGTIAKDVKGKATVESMNQPIKIHGVEVYPGDLIFADSEGVVIIPKAHEKAVINRAIEVIGVESNILNDITTNKSVEEILDANGYF